jgi:hypothetical protein
LPSIHLEIVDALPQAQKDQKGLRPIVITQLTSEYTNKLTATVVAAPSPTPAGGGMGGPGGGPEDFSNWDSGMGGGQQGLPGNPAGTVTPGVAAPTGESDRGYLITITGYVTPPAGANATPGYTVVNNYMQGLLGRAKKEGTKPYYFKAGENESGFPVVQSVQGGAAGTSVWGGTKGTPFWDVFAPEITGIKMEEKPGAVGGTMDVVPLQQLPQVDLFSPRNASGEVPSLVGAYIFTRQIKVYIKDAPATPAAK